MLVAGIQAKIRLDPRLKHSGVTILGEIRISVFDTSQLAAESLSDDLDCALTSENLRKHGNALFREGVWWMASATPIGT